MMGMKGMQNRQKEAPKPAAVAAPAPKAEAPQAKQAVAPSQAVSIEDHMAFIAPHEGRRNRAYDDSRGIRTVGIGLNLEKPESRQRLRAVGADYDAVFSGQQALTDQQVDALFRDDVEHHYQIALRQIPGLETMPRNIQLAMVDMVFNLGSLREFPKLRQALAARNWQKAADEMEDSRWFKQTGNRSRQLVRLVRGA
jgi:GH24 family phage-related lysozyme (muramidase)